MKSSRARAAPWSRCRATDDAWRMSRTPRFICAISTNRTPSRSPAPTRTLRHPSSPRTASGSASGRATRGSRRSGSAGGTAVTLTKAGNPLGISWGADDRIVYALSDGIWSVSGNGGAPEHLVKTTPGERIHAPQMLPGGQAVLFASTTASGPQGWDEGSIVVQALDSGRRTVLHVGGADPRYVSNRAPCVCLGQHAVRDTVRSEGTAGAWGTDTSRG